MPGSEPGENGPGDLLRLWCYDVAASFGCAYGTYLLVGLRADGASLLLRCIAHVVVEQACRRVSVLNGQGLQHLGLFPLGQLKKLCQLGQQGRILH